MRYVVEYKMHTDNMGHKITPYFIQDGGYFPVEDRKFVGITFDEKEVFLPAEVTILTKEDLLSRIVDFEDPDGNIILKETIIDNFLEDKGM